MLLLLAACADECPPGQVCTLAGTGDLGFNGEDLPALESWLYFPSSIRRDPEGRLAFADFNNMRIRAISEDDTLVTLAGNGDHAWSTPGLPPLESALENPVDAVWASDGTMYVMPLHEARVLRVAPGGGVEVYAGSGEVGYAGDGGDALSAAMSEAAGLALDDDGTLYISDTTNNAVRAVDTDGSIRTLAGDGTLGLTDGVPGAFSGPQRIVWADHVLYVADTNNHAVRAIDCETGQTSTLAGTGTAGYSGDGGDATAAMLNYPTGIDVKGDVVWIADSGNNVVRKIAGGVIETFAGTGEGGHTDGSLDEATFDFPAAVLAEEDRVYVADFLSGTIRVARAPK